MIQCPNSFIHPMFRGDFIVDSSMGFGSVLQPHQHLAKAQTAQVEPPTTLADRSMQSLLIDYDRFQSESLLNCFRAERDAIRELSPRLPITTNLMGAFKTLDYHRWAREMDIVSWDSYPQRGAAPADMAFNHSLMRGLKEGQSFMLMEQTPSQQNWQPYNALKRPGVMRLWSYQAMAHGADTVMYFQWRRSRGACEKFHGAVVEHAGTSEARGPRP